MSGSTILQVILGTDYVGSDLDIYFESAPEYFAFVSFITNLGLTWSTSHHIKEYESSNLSFLRGILSFHSAGSKIDVILCADGRVRQLPTLRYPYSS